jgi:hypothetical protein
MGRKKTRKMRTKQKPKSRPRKTRHYRKKARPAMLGGDKKVSVLVMESPTRPKYPVSRIIVTDGDTGKGSVYKLEEYMSDVTYGVEDALAALKQNKEGNKLPKQIFVNGFNIREPIYTPPRQ